jgi:sigma-E factor negative regulatory protein RseA
MVNMDGISALMDGELDEREAQRELARLKEDVELRERWDRFHLVSDALKGEPLLFADFREAFAERLAAEPTVLAPRRVSREAKRITTYALSAAASVSAAAFVAWVAMSPTGPGSLQAVAPNTGSVQAVPQLASVSSDSSMNEYILAHQGFSPSTALQGLAPYIRSVSTTLPAERR